MRALAGSTDQLFVDWGSSGATLGVRVLDNSGATTIARQTGFVEYPAGSGLYYLDPFTFPDESGSYTLVYDDDGGTAALGHIATEDLTVASSIGDPFSGDTYADTDELFRVLKIRTPSAAQTAAGERVLAVATYEIDRELDRPDDDPIAGAQVSLAEEVCLERAVEHWQQQEAAFGIIELGSGLNALPTRIARDTWERHANKLASAKLQWGLA